MFDPGVSSTNVDDEWGASAQALGMHAAGGAALPQVRRNSPEEVDYAELDFTLTGQPAAARQQVDSVLDTRPGQVQRASMSQMQGMTPAEADEAERMLMNDGDAQYFGQNFEGLGNSNSNGNNWPTMQGAEFQTGATEYVDVNDDFQAPQRASAARTTMMTPPHKVPSQQY